MCVHRAQWCDNLLCEGSENVVKNLNIFCLLRPVTGSFWCIQGQVRVLVCSPTIYFSPLVHSLCFWNLCWHNNLCYPAACLSHWRTHQFLHSPLWRYHYFIDRHYKLVMHSPDINMVWKALNGSILVFSINNWIFLMNVITINKGIDLNDNSLIIYSSSFFLMSL